MKELKRYHPLVITTYFLIWILFATMFSHPFFHLICLFGSYVLMMEFEEISIGKQLKWNIIMIALMSLSNPFFQHRGIIILTEIYGIPITLEALLYGLDFGCMLVSLINFMKVFSVMIQNDQIIYMLQKVSPNSAIVCSLSFQQIKQVKIQYRNIVDARALLYQPKKQIEKMKENIHVISALLTWLMESGIDTSMSMKSRGFGKGKRSYYQRYRFTKRDRHFMMMQVGLLCIAFLANQGISFAWYPTFFQQINVFQMGICFLAMLGCLLLPFGLKRKEIHTWDSITSK